MTYQQVNKHVCVLVTFPSSCIVSIVCKINLKCTYREVRSDDICNLFYIHCVDLARTEA